MSKDSKVRKRKYPEIERVRVTERDATSTQRIMGRMMGRLPLDSESNIEQEIARATPEVQAPSTIVDLDQGPISSDLSAPILQTAPILQVGATSQTVSTQNEVQPLPEVEALPRIAPVVQKGGGYTRLTHDVSDRIAPSIDVYTQSVLHRLLRLSWGFDKDTCQVGLPKLAKSCNISESQARRAARKLIELGYVAEIGKDFANKNQFERGSIYRILLPRAFTKQTAPASQKGTIVQTASSHRVPNK